MCLIIEAHTEHPSAPRWAGKKWRATPWYVPSGEELPTRKVEIGEKIERRKRMERNDNCRVNEYMSLNQWIFWKITHTRTARTFTAGSRYFCPCSLELGRPAHYRRFSCLHSASMDSHSADWNTMSCTGYTRHSVEHHRQSTVDGPSDGHWDVHKVWGHGLQTDVCNSN